MIKVRFQDDARLEFLDTIAYYENIEVGLGGRFRKSVEAAISLAVTLPLAGTPHKYGTRRVFPKKFPFSIIYLVTDEGIVIFAVAHFKKKPEYWNNRN